MEGRQVSLYRPGHEHFLTTVGRIIFNDKVERALSTALGDEYDAERFEFVSDFPRTASGKVRKDMLRAMVRSAVGAD